MDDLFTYPRDESADVRLVSERPKDSALVRDFTYRSPFSRRRAAYLVRPEQDAGGQHPAILYVHWYEPESLESNRTEFLDEAIQMAGHGFISMLVETMWSDRDWFIKRTQADDLQSSIEQVVELRQAMDLLLGEPGVDSDQFFYVGHDFGGMYGVLMGAVDPRPRGYVIMAATPRFPDWFLYYPRLEGAGREAFIHSFEPYDPIALVGNLSPAPVLFQFAEDDFHVPVERARAFFDAAKEPKELCWYQAGHGLNQQAAQDRQDWLKTQCNL